ncbi:MAG: single-stranded-DNA-specific exonuclease RecJ [Verrucomicrobia bacterium]|nr:single-stranded-DNA-specific exonuclease RecJ [Verrucomicrobiota bacterium]
MKRRWLIASPDPALQEQLADALRISTALAQVLINRGHRTPEAAARFLKPRLADLSDPFLLPDMKEAVARVFAAIERREKVVIFGDYDVDGITATAQLCQLLRALGAEVGCYLPNRMEEGYGLSQGAVEACIAAHQPKLLIAVDCGTTAAAQIEWLSSRGVDAIILDHHEMPEGSKLPRCVGVVNPKRETGETPWHHLASAGLAFKFGHALLKEGRNRNLQAAAAVDLKQWLDLAAIGTIADIVPLVGENRLIAAAGLPQIGATRRVGLRVLMEVAQIRPPVTPYHVGFGIGPRLNAAGRLQDAEKALELLLNDDRASALEVARWLDSNNRERQTIEKQIAEEATKRTAQEFHAHHDYVIVQADPAWHIGVVGIVASRVLRTFYRPTIIIGGAPPEATGDGWRGSGRSIEGYDITAGLAHCRELLLRFGGHEMAAGLSVKPENVAKLRDALNEHARQTIPAEALVPAWRLDAELSFCDLNEELIEDLSQIEPTGQENPRPLFCARGVRIRNEPRTVGKTGDHLKLWLTDGKNSFDAIGFGMGKRELKAGDAVDIVFAPEINEYEGRRSIQLKLQDVQPSEEREG